MAIVSRLRLAGAVCALFFAAALAPACAAPAYAIHAGDQLSVSVYGDQTLTQTVTVLPDGTIAFPLVGRIGIAGQSTDQAATSIGNHLKKYIKHPIVTVAVTTEGQLNVLVLGNVKTPGKYQLRSASLMTDAIAAAGGIGPVNGEFPIARVSDGTTANVRSVSLQKVLHDGDLTMDLPLQEGSVVYVPAPQLIELNVMGAVDKPGQTELNYGDRLSMAIAKAGNSIRSDADLNHVRVTRQFPDGHAETYEVNLYQVLENGDLSKDMTMHKNDVVFVPQIAHPGSHGSVLSPVFLLLRHLVGF